MAKRIIVPLDGTPASEAVLSVVTGSAQGTGAIVRLLHVAPVPDDVIDQDGRLVHADQEMARLEAARSSYLEGVGASLGSFPVERVVRFGDPAREILVEAEAWSADLIAMTVPPARWLDRIRRRRVAAQVARRATVPVVLYQPPRARLRLA